MNYLRGLLILLLLCNGCQKIYAQTSNTHIADSLDAEGEYGESLKYRELALAETGHTKNYEAIAKAKWHYTQACILEYKGGRENLLEALEHSMAANKVLADSDVPATQELWLRHLIFNRIYHLYGYTGQWPDALTYANKNYEVLRDTLPEYDQNTLYVIDDLGFVNTILRNPETANEFYERSLRLYKNHHPENLKDVYLNNHRMINNYRQMGLINEEVRLLNESEHYWTNIYQGEDASHNQYMLYQTLANWHTYYGNKAVAESYMFKKEALFDSVSKIRKATEKEALDKRERIWINEAYTRLYMAFKDYTKAGQYIQKNQELLNNTPNEYLWIVESKANAYVAESQLPNTTFEQAEVLLKKALKTLADNESLFVINTLPFNMALFDLYCEHQKQEQALKLFEEIIQGYPELPNSTRTRLLFKKAALLERILDFEAARVQYEAAISHLLKPSDLSIDFKSLHIDQLQEFYTFDILEGLLDWSQFYVSQYQKSSQKAHLEMGYNGFLLCSQYFERLYKGEAFNSNLYHYYQLLEAGLLECTLMMNQQSSIETTLEALENNSSKLTWSKFVYGKDNKTNVPDSLIFQEQKLKSLINYYQARLYESKNESDNISDSLKLHVTDLKNRLSKHQQLIKDNFSQYQLSGDGSFELARLKAQLGTDDMIFKYLISEDTVYLFAITDSNTELTRLLVSEDLATQIQDFVKTLSRFDSEVQIPETLQAIAEPMNATEKKRIVMVHSGLLNLLPFEVLLTDYFESDKVLHYSGSLKIYLEQMMTRHYQNTLNAGIYIAQNIDDANNPDYLPALESEVRGIWDVCEAQVYDISNGTEFIDNAIGHNVLHIAAHTTIDDELPELSVFNFAAETMLVGSLYNSSLKADLAVLSACDTGNGVLYDGEGVQSISKAFTFAGVPSSVMSLWKVDDKATSTIMTSFYMYLNAGASKDEALKRAKRDYLESDIDGELKHPYYWSAFVVSGNVQPLKTSTSGLWWMGLVLIPFLGFYAYKKSRA